eukprot:GHVS01087498.1.p1 GENE.GHVS01087498.1~~GHVS01087498.1.p1  ORF type:complete len:229 (-),score=57.51 GHVS01087498.1:396-1082(-)
MEELEEEEKRKGVIYIQRVPPFMTVGKVRDYFSQFGEVGKLFLTPQNKEQQHKRSCGSRQLYSDGWVEFADKRKAKRVALSLNNSTVGGAKRHNPWRDDLWNLKYLSKFRWHHLSEHTVYQRTARKDKFKVEMSKIKRENEFYLGQVEVANKRTMIDSKREAKKAKQEQVTTGQTTTTTGEEVVVVKPPKKKNEAVVKQRKEPAEAPVQLVPKKRERRASVQKTNKKK